MAAHRGRGRGIGIWVDKDDSVSTIQFWQDRVRNRISKKDTTLTAGYDESTCGELVSGKIDFGKCNLYLLEEPREGRKPKNDGYSLCEVA